MQWGIIHKNGGSNGARPGFAGKGIEGNLHKNGSTAYEFIGDTIAHKTNCGIGNLGVSWALNHKNGT